MEKLILHNINKSYERCVPVLKDISFSVAKGEFVVLLGPSGSGKSTILSIIAGFEQQTSGDIIIDGINCNQVPCQKREIASGIFVFATQHPCFVTLTEKYMTPHSYYDIAIEGQPKEQIYYHRSIQDIFNLCFRAGFVIDGFYEECFKTNKEIPMVMIVRLKKVKRDTLQ